MQFINEMPLWSLALAIFFLRIVDVSLGTIRTIAVVQGRQIASVLIGFFEVLIWVLAVSQVIMNVHDNPLLAVAFAGGFATGNAVGIVLERRLAIGRCVLRFITTDLGETVAAAIRSAGHVVTTFEGRGNDGPRRLLYTTCPRREAGRLIELAKSIDPGLFFMVDRFSQSGNGGPLPHATGWRAVFKKK
jgi:uncharacterized protein YebE (UPF0316 family)